jgi:exopolysaccharide biosynthesis polyprenyl glycosylphosphotransferase
MLKEQKIWMSRAFRFIDALLVFASFLFVHQLHVDRVLADHHVDADTLWLVQFLNVLVWVYLAKRLRIYGSRRMESFVLEIRDVIRATFIAMGLALVPLVFSGRSPSVFVFFAQVWAFQTLILVIFRFFLRRFLRYIRSRGYNFRRVLIVGCNERAAKLAQEIESSPHLGLHILGFIDAPNGNGHPAPDYPFSVLGTLDDLEKIARKQVIDEIFIRLPIKSFYSEIARILHFCETVGVEAKLPTDLFDLPHSKSGVSEEFGLPIIDLYTSPKMSGQLLIKRAMDVVISLSVLLACLPVFAVVALLIKTTSRGPIFFTQQRVGYNGRLFSLWKFRTMVPDAEKLKGELASMNEMDGPVFKIKNDPRITRVGGLLRRTSIDELPQLWNVLRGDMSLVGPRPPVPSEVEKYILRDRRRLSMKPGITGVWQVCGRNCVPFDKWMDMDRQYIDEWSLWLDLKLLAKTLPAVLKGTGS